MVNTTEIRVFMIRKGNLSVKDLSEKIGVSSATLGRWFDKNDMPTSAAEKNIKVLEIPEDMQPVIFFAHDVACKDTLYAN